MATNINNLKLTGVDFDDIKTSLKEYLKSQDQFKDYDFEGAGLNILLDVLSANTHMMAYYTNMAANESFLDSAVLRANVVSVAKHLNYVPSSYRSAIAYVDVEFLNLSDQDKINVDNGLIFIQQGDRFITNSGSRLFLFLATTNTKVINDNGTYIAKNVEIAEGAYRSTSFIYDDSSTVSQKFVIPDLNVDTTSLEVRVATSAQDTSGITDLWQQVTDINLANGESKVYFLQQNAELKYEIYFGDGIVGKKPDPGNLITIGYRVTTGEDANGLGRSETESAPAFRYAENSSTRTLLVTDTSGKPSPTYGGTSPEAIASIKYYAPRNYQAQERAVTAEDYRTLLVRDFGEQSESVFVWGGEDNDPPEYGKVFISIKPKNAEKFTTTQKLSIATNILKSKNVVSIIPEIVDPDYLYLILNVVVKYDKSKTTLTKENLETAIQTLLYNYASTNLGKFDRDFVLSAFTTYIDQNYAPPVLSNTVSVSLQKKLEPTLGSITTYSINFDNELYHPIDGYTPILSTTGFGYQDSSSTEEIKPNVTCYLDDDGTGYVRLYKLVGSTKVYLNNTLGTIDYTTGKISLTNFNPQYIVPEQDTKIVFTVIPVQQDILSRRNQILLMETTGITVSAVPQTLRYDTNASAAPFSGN